MREKEVKKQGVYTPNKRIKEWLSEIMDPQIFYNPYMDCKKLKKDTSYLKNVWVLYWNDIIEGKSNVMDVDKIREYIQSIDKEHEDPDLNINMSSEELMIYISKRWNGKTIDWENKKIIQMNDAEIPSFLE